MLPAPSLLTFDIFGTVVDWRRGLTGAVRSHGVELGDREFQAVIDWQARADQQAYGSYTVMLTRLSGWWWV